MTTFCLRTAFETKNTGFSAKTTLFTGAVSARFVREITLPILRHKVTGIGPSGKSRVQVIAENRTFRGDPLLLELLATDQWPEGSTPASVRPELQSRSAEVAAVLTWSLPGTIGIKLADALFSQEPEDSNDEWTWNDVQPVAIGDFCDDISTAQAKYESAQEAMEEQKKFERSAIVTAMRWWRQGGHADAPVDKFIAYWVVLETFSAQVSNANSIRTRIQAALSKIFSELAQVNAGQRIAKMRDVLYGTRCKAVHAGRRDISSLNTLVQLASSVAKACIIYLLEGTPSDAPEEHVLQTFDI